MSWVRVDDQLHAHPKVARAWRADPGSLGLHLLALSYSGCFLTDGVVPIEFVEQKVPDSAERERLTTALVSAGLWHPHDAGFEIHDFLEYCPSRTKALAERKRKQKAGRQGARVTNSQRSRNPAPDAASAAGADEGADGASVAPVPVPLPVPIERSSDADVPGDSEVLFVREVVGRFNEAATDRNITVNARLIERALKDHAHVPVSELRRVAFTCADWLAAHAPRNGSQPRVAHLTLRKFMRDLPAASASSLKDDGW